MKKIRTFIVFLSLSISFSAFGQFKNLDLQPGQKINIENIEIQNIKERKLEEPSSIQDFQHNSNQNIYFLPIGVHVTARTLNGKPTFIVFEKTVFDNYSYDSQVQSNIKINDKLEKIFRFKDALKESRLLSITSSDNNEEHIKYIQTLNGLDVYGSEYYIHVRDKEPYAFNGVIYDLNMQQVPGVSEAISEEAVRSIIENAPFVKNIKKIERNSENDQLFLEDSYTLLYYTESIDSEDFKLAWKVEYHPNIDKAYTIFVDALTGNIIDKFSKICHIHEFVMDGPKTGLAKDLLGNTRQINYYEHQGTGLLIDVSKPMYNGGTVNITEPKNALWTIDANNTMPGDKLKATQVTSTNGFQSNPTAVSAHYNASVAYDYYYNTFNRNSIDGKGGTMLSFINVSQNLENAFWNGAAIFYGNGGTNFKPFARGLDVAGHEMTHGVIQSTANLEYQDEPGAINESLADVFGVMIDRDDWYLGEDIVNINSFPTGKMRDFTNPNNGGSGTLGYQPDHYRDVYKGTQDNGGVHINSGITNKAFYLFASQVGKERAEQVYYCAMTKYLTRRSQFIDLRAAVEKCAQDLYDNSVSSAASNAFAQVGVGQGGSTDDNSGEINPNQGKDYILAVENISQNTFIVDKERNVFANPLTQDKPISKPSITDDGSFVVYVNASNQIAYINIDWLNLTAESGVLIDNKDQQGNPTPWRNVSIDPTGYRIAFVSAYEENIVYLYDFSLEEFLALELYTPTFSEGIKTNTVQYADAMCFDNTGEYLIYDSYNILKKNFGSNIEYWDIAYTKVFDKVQKNWSEINIYSMFGRLPEGISIGNPAIAKNQNNLMIFDLQDASGYYPVNYIAISNLNSSEVSLILENSVISYPSYSRLDDYIIFSSTDQSSNNLVGLLPMTANGTKVSGDAFGFINGYWASWFGTGKRNLVNAEEIQSQESQFAVYPNPTGDNLYFRPSRLDLEPKEYQYQIVDIHARKIVNGTFNGGSEKISIPIGNLNMGLYFLLVKDKDKMFTTKFVKGRQ